MSWINYNNRAENIAKRLEAMYNMIGGSFLFFWVENAPTFTLSYTATAHFTPALAGKAARSIMDFFYESMKKYVSTPSGTNLWCIAGKLSRRKVITTAPENLRTEKMAIVTRNQLDQIIRMVHELKEERLPFIFLYRIPARSGAAGAQVIKEVFSANPQHQEMLVGSDGWRQIVDANHRTLTPSISQLIPQKGPAKRQKLQRAPPGGNQSTEARGAVGGGWRDAEEMESLRRQYLQPLHDVGMTDALIQSMKHVMDTGSIPAAVVLNDASELQVVMPDFVGHQEKGSQVPVLVSTIKYIF
jgi:hypothetical protein